MLVARNPHNSQFILIQCIKEPKGVYHNSRVVKDPHPHIQDPPVQQYTTVVHTALQPNWCLSWSQSHYSNKLQHSKHSNNNNNRHSNSSFIGFCTVLIILGKGPIEILLKKAGRVGGVGLMPTIDYKVGG